jgi:DNA polymerase III epsilon subunit family exonuclease
MLADYVVLDVETTGLSKHFCKITEIAALKVRDNRVVDKFQSLINPECPIPEFITHLTGIDNELVKYERPIKEVIPGFIDFLGEDIMVGHNVGFDYGFINHNSQKHLEKTLLNNRLCTIKLSRRLLPDLASRKLASLCDYFEVINEKEHRAMGDCVATNKIFAKMNGILHNNGITEREDILKFQKSKIPRIDYFQAPSSSSCTQQV